MRRLLVAIGCLTVLPLEVRGAVTDEDCGGSLLWFPVVGLGVGVVLVGAHRALTPALSQPVVAAVLLIAWVVLTGAMHLDGFGDLCDGLYGGKTPEARLAIMKDPHVGVMAVVAISCLLILKCALLGSLAMRGVAVSALLLSPCLGRWAMVLLATTMPYARAGGGTGAPFVRSARVSSLMIASAMALAAAGGIGGGRGLGLCMIAVGISLIVRYTCGRLLGGITGDGLGAVGELVEAGVLIGCVV